MSTVCTTSLLCRLCLNKEELIYVYDERLANGHQLRMCILLCTGVQIDEEDSVSKMVCHKCCSLAVKLYQYRQTALANDKALKEIAKEPFNEPPTNKDAILEMHNSILETISQCKVSENVAQVYRVPLDDVSEVNNEDKVTKDVITDNDDSNNSAHATVKEIFQYFPTTAVPREILDSNVLPSVPVDKDIKNYVGSEYEVMPADNSDGRVLKFKRKYPATDVVKLSVKKPRKESYNSYSSDSDCSVPPVFKSRKKHPNPTSDASYSDCDSDYGDEDVGEKLPLPPAEPTTEPPATGESSPNQIRTNTRPSRSKVSKNPLQFPDSDSDNEVAKKPANTKYCAICDRTFWGWSQLKSHQRTHLRCVICRIICDSQEDLEYHVKNVCYKNMEYNQPILLLPKVDENPFMLHIYRDAFERYFQDIEDGVYGPTEPPPPPDPDYPFYHDEERVRVENEFIGSVFEKFKHLDNTPVVRNKISQTRRAETHIKYYSRNQIVLEDMYQDLDMYKVPINVIVSPRVSAHLSFATKPVNRAEPFEKWSVDEVVDIVLPQKDPTYFLRPKKPPPPKNVANTTVVKKQPIKNEKHPKLLKALTSSTSASNQTTTSITTTSSSGDKTKSYNIAKLLSTTVTTPQQNTPVPKPVNTVTTTTLNQISQLRLPTRISSEVSLVPKSATVPKTSESISTFRLPILTQSAQPPQQRLPPPRAPPILPQQHSQLLPLPYIKEEPELTPQSPIEMPPHIQPVITPSHRPPPYSNMFRLPAPPIHNQHNQNELYLKQEKDIEENLSYPSPSQYSRPNINYQNHSYRMPLSKPASHVGYNHQPVYPTQQLRYRVAERKANAMINNQYYNTNHHQNGMRYRSVSGGSMMVLPNTTTNQNGGLLNQIPPPPTNLNSMPATHLLQSMNHMSNTLTHHSPLSHAQQNQVNSVYNQPNIGKMSPISSVPSPLHSIPSPIETKPLSSPINSMPSPLSNYNSSYNTSSNLYDHNYSDSFSNNSYSDSFSASYLQPQPAQQYIPPYSPHNHMEIDPFVDQMLQQAAGSNNNKTALRVKQPWELNQT